MTGSSPLSGTYRLATPTVAQLGAGTVEVQSGAQLYVSGAITYNNTLILSGTGFADSAGNIGALRLDGATWAGNIAVNGSARIGAHNSTGTISGNISGGNLEFNATNFNNSYTIILTGTNSYGTTTIGGPNVQVAGIPLMRVNVGSGGTTGTLGTGNVIINGDGANGVLGFDRSNGYTLLPGQTITGAVGAGTIANSITRTFIDFDTLGTGFSDNGSTITLGAAAPSLGGNIRIGQARANTVTTFTGTVTAEKIAVSSVANAATLNIGPGANISANFFTIGETASATGGVVSQTGGTVTVLGQLRAAHFGTETATYNMGGGTLTLTGASPSLTPSTAAAGGASATGDNNINGGATATIHGGGIYLGIDGTGVFNHTGGTVTTNWIVLDNRTDTPVGTNMADGIDRYSLSGAGSVLALRSTWGLIQRNASSAVSFGGGTVRVDNTGTGANITIPLDATIDTVAGTTTNLDTNGASNGLTLTRDVRGGGTLNLTGGGTINVTTTGFQGIAPSLTSTGAAASLTKLGAGATTLTGSGAGYTGVVTVSAGRLNVPNNLAAASLTVADGAALGGEPATTVANLGTSTGSSLFFNPNTAGALTATNLVLNGTTTIDFSTAPTAASPFTVLNYTSVTGGLTFALANAASYRASSIVTSVPGTVTLNVTTKSLAWTGTGAVTTVWDNNGNTNWVDTSPAADKFFAGDTVTFGDGPGVVGVTVTSGVSPWKTTVNSNTNNYALTSTANGIAGSGNLEKSGASTLALAGPNTYSGQTVVSGGILAIAAATSLGNASATNSIALSGGGQLRYTGITALDYGTTRGIAVGAGGGIIAHSGTTAVTMTVSGNISGSASLKFSTTGTSGTVSTVTNYALNGDDSAYTGNITVEATGNILSTLLLNTQSAVPNAAAITLNLKGTQTYSALTTSGGTTNINSALGTGSSTITANAATNIYASQTLAALTIGNGVEVTFGDGLPFAPEPEKGGGFSAPVADPLGGAVVPEPGALGLLLASSLGLFARRWRMRG